MSVVGIPEFLTRELTVLTEYVRGEIEGGVFFWSRNSGKTLKVLTSMYTIC